MKNLFCEIRSAVAGTLILVLVCCGAYPIVVFAIAQIAFPDRANGSLIVDNTGTVRGTKLLGQNFSGGKYFHPRPSAAGAGYDAANSSGSNLGPTSQKLRDAVKERIEVFRKENGLKADDAVPADAVTASGSGLDPHISLRNAEIQTARVARVRGMTETEVRLLVKQNTKPPDLGVLGEPAVNVLTLNMALDATANTNKP